jgi:4-amino-4-deoxy-L-arabinose transferase-like glycosyltransferase
MRRALLTEQWHTVVAAYATGYNVVFLTLAYAGEFRLMSDRGTPFAPFTPFARFTPQSPFAQARRHWARSWRGGVLLVLGGVALLWPGQRGLPPIDRDEARFAEATRQMLCAADWRGYIVPTVDGRPRLSKPPVIYWLQAAAVRLCGPRDTWRPDAADTGTVHTPRLAAAADPRTGDIWAWRLPSLVAALVAGLLTWRLGRAMFGGAAGWLAGLLLMSCAVVLLDARQARADQVLLACTLSAQLALWHIWRQRPSAGDAPPPTTVGAPQPTVADAPRTTVASWRWPLVLWVAMAVGVMTKGPITPLVTGLTAAALSVLTRRYRWLWHTRPLIGAAVVLATAVPWIVLVGQAAGWQTLWHQMFVRELLARATQSLERPWLPPGYYLALLPLLFWPASLTLVPALMRLRRALRGAPAATEASASPGHSSWWTHGWQRWRRRLPGRPAELFCLAWLLPAWLVFELAGTKLPHYVLPLLPALALLGARGTVATRRTWRPLLAHPWGRLAIGGWLALSTTIALVLPILLTRSGQFHADGATRSAWLAALAGAAVLLVLIVWSLRRQRVVLATLLSIGLAAVAAFNVLGAVLPWLGVLWLSPRVVDVVRAADPGGQRPLAAAGYHEESLLFLTRGRVQRLGWAELRGWQGSGGRRTPRPYRAPWAWLEAHPDGLVVVALDRAEDLPTDVRVLARLDGFNYANLRAQRLFVVERADHADRRP